MREQMRRRLEISLLCFTGVTLMTVTGHGQGDELEEPARPDIVTISIADSTGHLERAPVLFPHDLHTDALVKQGKDCTACHLQRDDGRLTWLFFVKDMVNLPRKERWQI